MPRPPRFVVPGLPHHVTQRGNYRQQVFFDESDYLLYLRLLRLYSQRLDVTIQAFCLMPNHVHLILTPSTQEALPCLLQRLHGDYARVKHIRHERKGHLWQARYYSTPMDEAYFWNAMVYVEQNPQRAGLVEQCGSWRWSSAGAHLRNQNDGLVDISQWRRRHTPATWLEHLAHGVRDAELLGRIREATTKGWPLGSDAFLDSLASDLGRPTRRGQPGPKPKKSGVMVSDTDLLVSSHGA